MSDNTVHAHEGAGCDTLSSTCVPIILVPGVMGSRFQFGQKAWDPDDGLGMVGWSRATGDRFQKNRAAFSIDLSPGSPIKEPHASATRGMLGNSALCAIALRDMGLDPALAEARSIFQEVKTFETTRNWNSVAWSFYGSALMRFETEFNATRRINPVYACGYDWRQSNETSGQKLAQFITDTLSQNPGADQVILVSHSMGGLVVRGAMMGDPSLKDKIRGVIHGVQPSLGAVVCYSRLICGMMAPVEDVSGLDPTSLVVSGFVGQTGDQFAYTVSGMPGPLELLPNHLYQSFLASGKWLDGLDPGDDLNDVYSIYLGSGPAGLVKRVAYAQNMRGTKGERDGQTVVSDFTNHMAVAKSFHERLASAPNAGFHPNTVALYSLGVATVYNVRFRTDNDPAHLNNLWSVKRADDGTVVVTDNANKVAYTRSSWGDQMVPDISGKCLGAPNAVRPPPVRGAVHGDVYKNEEFQNLVLNFIRQMLQGAPVCAENDATASSDQVMASNDGTSADGSSGDESDAGDDSSSDAPAEAQAT